ncbi:hypothetical protein HHI36_016394, partial [Cryptolaemus montrouzieri]
FHTVKHCHSAHPMHILALVYVEFYPLLLYVQLLHSLGLFAVHYLGAPTGAVVIPISSKKDNRAKHPSLELHAATFAAISTIIAVPLTYFGDCPNKLVETHSYFV